MKRLALILLLATFLAPTAKAVQEFPQLNAVVKQVAGHGVAKCLEYEEEPPPAFKLLGKGVGAYTTWIKVNGQAVRPGGYIIFSPRFCQAMLEVMANLPLYTNDVYLNSSAQEFLLFTHELGHMTGMENWKNEAVVGCWGIQHVYGVMLLLGVPANYANTLYQAAKYEYTLWPADYHLKRCSTW